MKIPTLLRNMDVGDTVVLPMSHKKDTTVALSARRAGFVVQTKKVVLTDSALTNCEGVCITLMSEFNQQLKDANK